MMNPLFNAIEQELKRTTMIYLYGGKVNNAMLAIALIRFNKKD